MMFMSVVFRSVGTDERITVALVDAKRDVREQHTRAE